MQQIRSFDQAAFAFVFVLFCLNWPAEAQEGPLGNQEGPPQPAHVMQGAMGPGAGIGVGAGQQQAQSTCTPEGGITGLAPCGRTFAQGATVQLSAGYTYQCYGMPPGSCSFKLVLKDTNTTTGVVKLEKSTNRTVNCGNSETWTLSEIYIAGPSDAGTHKLEAIIMSGNETVGKSTCTYEVSE